jgi:hypothetical protein
LLLQSPAKQTPVDSLVRQTPVDSPVRTSLLEIPLVVAVQTKTAMETIQIRMVSLALTLMRFQKVPESSKCRPSWLAFFLQSSCVLCSLC